jgi:hypothetical protein
MDFHIGTAQLLQKPERVNRPARAGDAYYYSQIASSKTAFVPKLEQLRIYLIEARTDRKI